MDGVPAEVTPYRNVLQSVEVPPGESVVTWRYDPVSMKVGLALSSMTLVGLFFLWLSPPKKPKTS